MSLPRRKVPIFALYGEHQTASTLAHALHIESIQSRSHKYLGRIETHRHVSLSQLVLLSEGPAVLFLDDRRYEFSSRAAVIIPAGTIHSFQFSPDTQGRVLTFNLDYLLTAAGADHRMRLQHLFSDARAVDLQREVGLFERISQLLVALEAEFWQPENDTLPVCGWLASCVLSILSFKLIQARSVEHRPTGDANHLRRFRQLIEDKYRQHWPTQRFAQEMGVSEASLNRLCQRVSGTTAFDLIQQRVALEARRQLMYSQHSVSAIASGLGFKDVAYFCRFFRRRCGATPNDFRRKYGGG